MLFSTCQGRIQDFGLRGRGTSTGVWGQSPQRGPGAEPRWGSGGEAPEAGRMLRHVAEKNHLWKEKQVHTDRHGMTI